MKSTCFTDRHERERRANVSLANGGMFCKSLSVTESVLQSQRSIAAIYAWPKEEFVHLQWKLNEFDRNRKEGPKDIVMNDLRPEEASSVTEAIFYSAPFLSFSQDSDLRNGGQDLE